MSNKHEDGSCATCRDPRSSEAPKYGTLVDAATGEWRCFCQSDPAFDRSMNIAGFKECGACGAHRPLRSSDDPHPPRVTPAEEAALADAYRKSDEARAFLAKLKKDHGIDTEDRSETAKEPVHVWPGMIVRSTSITDKGRRFVVRSTNAVIFQPVDAPRGDEVDALTMGSFVMNFEAENGDPLEEGRGRPTATPPVDKRLHEATIALLGVVQANRLMLGERMGVRYLGDLEKRARTAIDAYAIGGEYDQGQGRERATPVRSRDDWHEDDGAVLWWEFPVKEPPYAGTPLDDDFPEYMTHWTPIVVPEAP